MWMKNVVKSKTHFESSISCQQSVNSKVQRQSTLMSNPIIWLLNVVECFDHIADKSKHNNMNQHKIIEDEDKDDEEDEEEEEEDSPLKLRKFLETQQGNNLLQYF